MIPYFHFQGHFLTGFIGLSASDSGMTVALKPLTNVTINSVIIRRVGTNAEAFDIHAQGLPVVTSLPLQIAAVETNAVLTFSNRLGVENWLARSTNLTSWSGTFQGLEAVAVSTNTIVTPANVPQEFFALSQAQYAEPFFTPTNVLGSTMALAFGAYNGTVTCHFNTNGSGTYTWTVGAPGTINSYQWSQDPLRGRLRSIVFSGIKRMDLHLDFDSTTNGTFKGTADPSGTPIPVSGTFTYTP